MPVAGSVTRQPRGLVRVNGQIVPFESWSVDQNTYFAADTFRVAFPIGTLPKGYDPAWWAGVTEIDIEVFAGFPSDPNAYSANDLDSLIYGRVDELTYDPVARTFEASGRDLTALLIDDKVALKATNQTSSQVVTQLANQYGLTPVVTATTTKIGTYFQIDHVREGLSRPAWDLITYLARREQFLAYVIGKELHFEPAPAATQKPYVFEYTDPATSGGPPQFYGTSLKVQRSLTMARDVKVIVTGRNLRTGKTTTKTAEMVHSKNRVSRRSPVPSGETQVYSFTYNNLTPEGMQAKANELALEISKHEVKLEIEGPAQSDLKRTDVIQLKGTACDQIFYIDSLARSMSVDDGYAWRIEAKNHSPESAPAL